MTEPNFSIWFKVKKGNIKAFESLYKFYFPSLCLYAYGFVPDRELVKEIVNDVFLRIWERRTLLDIRYGIKPYLYRCVHNSCLDHLKTKKFNRQNQLVDISEKIKELPDNDDEYILTQLSLNQLEKEIMAGIDNLPQKCREVFLLSRFELLSYNEISEKLNISVNTVKTQICRALDSLRVSLRQFL